MNILYPKNFYNIPKVAIYLFSLLWEIQVLYKTSRNMHVISTKRNIKNKYFKCQIHHQLSLTRFSSNIFEIFSNTA